MNLDTTLQRIEQLRERIHNLIENTMRFHWSHTMWLQYRREGILTEEFKRLPRWAKEYLSGYEDALMGQLWRKVIFSYVINGKREPIDSKAFRDFPPSRVKSEPRHHPVETRVNVETGCYVWRLAPDKLWTEPKEGMKTERWRTLTGDTT